MKTLKKGVQWDIRIQQLRKVKEIRLVLSEPGALPKVMADRVKSEWILSNLLSNAIRYSYDNSEVGIKVSLTPTHVEIAVQDSGIGIAEEYHDKVFEKYFRVPGNEKEGTGLGLSISKEFINAMGGYLKMSSEIGTGSVFIAGFRIEA